MKKLLIIDDDPAILKTLALHFQDRFRVSTAGNGAEGLKTFLEESPAAVILDLRLPDASGLDLLDKIRQADPGAHVIAVTAFQDMESTVGAIKKGAFDYMSKPLGLKELDLSIKKIIQNIELHGRLKDLVSSSPRSVPGTIVGRDRQMEEIFKTIAVASESRITVLIQGESGTGKELIARAVHFNSRDKDGPFIAINCSALVETLLESELFGYEKGAFTGAVARKEGKFEAARGGTVFLDEVGEMSQGLQVKLLRVLQERSFERVGGSETIRTDARVIAATNRDLKELTSRGLFRQDLYYRLNVLSIAVPPLRERTRDIGPLVNHMLKKANAELHKNVRRLPKRVMDLLANYSWPGNVRELENVITRGVLLSKGDVLTDVCLSGAAPEGGPKPDWRPAALDGVEKEHIARSLEHTGWNMSRAAVLLGISMPRLSRKIKKYGLRR